MPHATITLTEDEDGDLDVSVTFDPPYSAESPQFCHNAALRAVELLATSLGDSDPEVLSVSREP